MIRKILVPTDFSLGAAAALASAVDLARAVGAELLLLHVHDEFPFVAPDGEGHVPRELLAQIEQTVDKELAERVGQLKHQGIAVRGLRLLGTAHVQIVRTAEREHCELVVMGTAGRSALGRVLLGSVAERVVRTATVPVMIVPAQAHSASDPRAATP